MFLWSVTAELERDGGAVESWTSTVPCVEFPTEHLIRMSMACDKSGKCRGMNSLLDDGQLVKLVVERVVKVFLAEKELDCE